MVPFSDLQKAEELREKFNFKLIEKGEEIPLTKLDIWTKKRVVKYFIIFSKITILFYDYFFASFFIYDA